MTLEGILNAKLPMERFSKAAVPVVSESDA